MKRILTAIGTSLVLAATAGCSVPTATNGSVSNRMGNAFSAEITMTTTDTESKASLTRYGTDAWNVLFSEPSAIAGVQLEFMDNDIKASYKGLEFSVPQSAQAVKTYLQKLMDVVDDMALESDLSGGKSEDDRIIFEGEIPEGGYTFTFSEDGTPLEFSLSCYNLVICFDSFTDNGAAPDNTGDVGNTETTELPTQTEDSTQSDAAVESSEITE